MVSVIRLCLSNGFEAIRDMSESCCAPSSCCRSLNPKEREGGGREGMRSRGDARKERKREGRSRVRGARRGGVGGRSRV